MNEDRSVDAALVKWGERLFYPANRTMKPDLAPRLRGTAPIGWVQNGGVQLDTVQRRADAIRMRIEAVVRRAPQVMVRHTGGARGMTPLRTHLRYITGNGQREFEDDRGVQRRGAEALQDLAEQWRYGGSLIREISPHQEAQFLVLSMPAGTDAALLKDAVRDFARTELAGHRYVMVLHEHQSQPHVHLSVRRESMTGTRLHPSKADLHRWREVFADLLRARGVAAEATRQVVRGELRSSVPLWRVRAIRQGQLAASPYDAKAGAKQLGARAEAASQWAQLTQALAKSDRPDDQALARRVADFLRDMPYIKQYVRAQARAPELPPPPLTATLTATLTPPQPAPQLGLRRAAELHRERTARDIER